MASQADCFLHRTGIPPQPIHFAKSSTQYSSLSRRSLLTRCQTFTSVPRNTFTWGSHKPPVFSSKSTFSLWLRFIDCNQRLIDALLIVARHSISPNSTGSKFCHTRIKNLDLSSLAEPRRLTFLGEARTQLPDQDDKNCNHKNNNYFSSIHNIKPSRFLPPWSSITGLSFSIKSSLNQLFKTTSFLTKCIYSTSKNYHELRLSYLRLLISRSNWNHFSLKLVPPAPLCMTSGYSSTATQPFLKQFKNLCP